MANNGVITYNHGPINELLGEIRREMVQFNQLNDEMVGIRNKVEAEWDSNAAQAFREVHTRWTNNVHEVQAILNQIIIKSGEGADNMLQTDSGIAKTFG